MGALVLALNAGSSNLKCALFELRGAAPAEVARTRVDTHGAGEDRAAAAKLLDWAASVRPGEDLAAAGHRVVHGGVAMSGPVLIDDQVIEALEELTPLAPLHQPQSLAVIRAVAALRPGLAQVACFDTAFHRTQPAVAVRFGLPRALHDQGVRRYGFHGLNYEHVAARLAGLDPATAGGRVIAAHLGSGASLCAMSAGASVDTTMGFSPLDGLVMSTRPGALDPGVILHLQLQRGMTAAEVQDLLYHRSGLLGVSGLSGDMRTLLESPAAEAAEAVDLFVHRAAREAAALAGSLGGLDGVIFTGGIGENSPRIRARIAEKLAWLGLDLDADANAGGGEGRISAAGARVCAWIIPADEEQVIARQTASLTGSM